MSTKSRRYRRKTRLVRETNVSPAASDAAADQIVTIPAKRIENADPVEVVKELNQRNHVLQELKMIGLVTAAVTIILILLYVFFR